MDRSLVKRWTCAKDIVDYNAIKITKKGTYTESRREITISRVTQCPPELVNSLWHYSLNLDSLFNNDLNVKDYSGDKVEEDSIDNSGFFLTCKLSGERRIILLNKWVKWDKSEMAGRCHEARRLFADIRFT